MSALANDMGSAGYIVGIYEEKISKNPLGAV